MNGWSVWWLIWFLVTLTSFAVPEAYALVTRHPENTLSSQIWALEGVVPGRWTPIWMWSAGHYLVGFGLGLILIWLFFHFLFGMFA